MSGFDAAPSFDESFGQSLHGTGDLAGPRIESDITGLPDPSGDWYTSGDGPGREIGADKEAGNANVRSSVAMLAAGALSVAAITGIKYGIDSGWFADQFNHYRELYTQWARSHGAQQ